MLLKWQVEEQVRNLLRLDGGHWPIQEIRGGGNEGGERDRNTLMGHTLEFKNNPEEDAP